MVSLPKLGPFRLHRPLAQGGMAMVWRAVHEAHDHPVAIKFITGERARKPRFVESFHWEVRTVARLNHPNIIRVFDYGEIPDEVAAVADDHLTAGSPYMVMELASSTLGNVERSRLQWNHIHTILTQILDALAHAHARGLVHRDLKPSNVLFLSEADRGELKLSDFGVAHAIDSKRQLKAEDDVITGTPRFMAPEQITGQLRDQGPWTDLYALGCLTYWLTSGDPPFSANSLDEVLRSHLTEPRPPLEPTIDVPEGFDEFCHRLVARDPEHRFRRAADAAAALAEIAGAAPGTGMKMTAQTAEGDPVDLTLMEAPDATHVLDQTVQHHDSPSSPQPAGRQTFESPDLPDSWERGHSAADPMEMIGVGLGLFELREIPLVGRHRHRDVLWNNLGDVRYTRRPHVVMLDGPAGIGKTRLATWLAHRAHEVGAVDVLTAHHSPISGPADGLSRMFANHLRCTGLAREQILERVRDFYGDDSGLDSNDLHQCVALTELLVPGADPEFDENDLVMQFNGPEQRFAVWRRLLVRLGDRRPLLVILDDVHWGHESLQFVRFIIEETAGSQLPVLFVMTARSDQLEENSSTGRIIDDITDQPCSHHLQVGPLARQDHHRLVENLLRLEPDLARRVAERTAGNPLFAIQLVGNWVERGLLDVGEDGFRLADGREPPLPDDVHGLLVDRLEKLTGQSLDEPAGDALKALELAAALGRDVDATEWRRLCELDGISPPDGLPGKLAAQSLARLDEFGWSFTHGALRETLERVASEHGRLQSHHLRCVQMLHRLYDTSQQSLAPRLARHLLAAGDHRAALEPLLESLDYYRRISDYETGERFFGLFESTRQTLSLDENDRKTIDGWLAGAEIYQLQWKSDEATALFDRCERVCKTHGWDDLRARTELGWSRFYSKRGQYEQAIDYGHRALHQFRDTDNHDALLRGVVAISFCEYKRSNFKEVLRICRQYDHHLRASSDPEHAADVNLMRGLALTEMGEYERARRCYQTTLEVSEQLGSLFKKASCHNNLGDLHRKQGDLNRAEEHYRHATELYRRIGSGDWAYPRFNLGMTRLEQEDFESAGDHFTAALEEASRVGHAALQGASHAALAACGAGCGQWKQVDEHLEETERHLDGTGHAGPDLAEVLQIAAEQSDHRGATKRAQRAYRLVLQQWRELGERSRATEVQSRLEELQRR